MRINKQFYKSIALTTLLYTGFAAGSIAQDRSTIVNPETKAPVILSTTPSGGEENVDQRSVIEITFNSDMDETTINDSTLMLHANSVHEMHGEMHDEMQDEQKIERPAIRDSKNNGEKNGGAVSGTISYSDKVAVFTPDEELEEGTLYTLTVTNGVQNSENIALETEYKLNFITMGSSDMTYSDSDKKSDRKDDRNRYGMEEAKDKPMHTKSTDKAGLIKLGKAGQFVILAKTNINNESDSRITGHTGEGSAADSSKKEKSYSDSDAERERVSDEIIVSHSDQTETETPDVSEAIEDMMSAYSDVSNQNGDDLTSHETAQFYHSDGLSPGVHEWNNSLHLDSNVSLSGSEDDVWLFKVNEDLTVDENVRFTLTDGAQADNVFWFVEGEVTIGKNAQFEGIILSMNEITLEKGAKLNGRMFSQSSITLDDNTVTQPERMYLRSPSTER